MPRFLIVVASLAAALVGAAVAFAGGGQTIAAAATLPLGARQTNSLNGIDYWRLSVDVGDQIVLDYGRTESSTYYETEVCVLRPDVTDYTVAKTPCAVHNRRASATS